MVVLIITRHGNTRKCEKPSYMMSQLNWKSFLSLNAVTQERHACCRFEPYWHQIIYIYLCLTIRRQERSSKPQDLGPTRFIRARHLAGVPNRDIIYLWNSYVLHRLIQGVHDVVLHSFLCSRVRQLRGSKQNEFTPVFNFVIINM